MWLAVSARKPAGEHRQPVEQALVVGVEQVVGPGDGGAEAAVAVWHASAGHGQHVLAFAERLADLGRGHRHHPGRRQLQGERQAVQLGAEGGDLGVVVYDRGASAQGGSAEELDGGGGVPVGLQWLYPNDPLAG